MKDQNLAEARKWIKQAEMDIKSAEWNAKKIAKKLFKLQKK